MRRLVALASVLAVLAAGCLEATETEEQRAAKRRAGTAVNGTQEFEAPDLPASAKWAALADASLPRVEHCAANVGAKFYIIGGYIVPQPVSPPGAAGGVPAAVPTATVEIYDATSNSFAKGPDYPVSLDHCLATSIGDTIYVIHQGNSNKIKVGAGAWTTIRSPPHTHSATGVAEEIGGKIYVTGGGGSGNAFVDVYDPALDAWTSYPEASNLPTVRNHMGGAALNGRLYAIGGDIGGHSRNTGANEEFDPITGVWTKRADLPVVRGSLHAFAWKGHVIVMGGQNGATNVPSFADVHAYNPITDTWTPLPKMSNPRHGFAGGVHDGKIFVFAGAPQQGVSGFAKTDALVPS